MYLKTLLRNKFTVLGNTIKIVFTVLSKFEYNLRFVR